MFWRADAERRAPRRTWVRFRVGTDGIMRACGAPRTGRASCACLAKTPFSADTLMAPSPIT